MDEKIVKDCISRRQAVYVCLELIHERRKWLSDAGQKEISGIDAAMCAIQDLPSAQPDIVRCKDCKHKFIENGVWNCPFGLSGGELFFCGYGNRQEDDK